MLYEAIYKTNAVSAGQKPADTHNFVGKTWASKMKIDVDFGKY